MRRGLTALSSACIALMAAAMPAPACAGASDAAQADPIILPNVEDLIVLPAGRWALASSMAGREETAAVFAIETATAKIAPLFPRSSNHGNVALQSGNLAGCHELPAETYRGHGLSYISRGKGGGTLYVVNHGARESIEVYDVEAKPDGSVPRTVWRGCILAPAGSVGNAVAAASPSALYATFRPASGGLFTMGGVRRWTSRNGWEIVPLSEVRLPSGIALAKGGGKIYVTSYIDRKVVEVTVRGKPRRREISLDFNPDNLSWANDGALLVAGANARAGDPSRECETPAEAGCTITGYVANIDPRNFSISCKTAVGPNAVTIAAQVGRELWLSASHGPRIARIPFANATVCKTRTAG